MYEAPGLRAPLEWELNIPQRIFKGDEVRGVIIKKIKQVNRRQGREYVEYPYSLPFWNRLLFAWPILIKHKG